MLHVLIVLLQGIPEHHNVVNKDPHKGEVSYLGPDAYVVGTVLCISYNLKV